MPSTTLGIQCARPSLAYRRRARRSTAALLLFVLATLALEWRHADQQIGQTIPSAKSIARDAAPAPYLGANRSCSVAMCSTDKFPTIGSKGGKIGRLSAGIGPDDSTERNWVRQRQQELLGTDTSDRGAEAAHKLVVMVGSSPFRYAVARHWCTAFQKVPVCSPIWEPVRKQGIEGSLLTAKNQCGATHRRHVCTELCALHILRVPFG